MNYCVKIPKSLNPIKFNIIYIYIEKPLYSLEMYSLKKVKANTMYNLNHFLKKNV